MSASKSVLLNILLRRASSPTLPWRRRRPGPAPPPPHPPFLSPTSEALLLRDLPPRFSPQRRSRCRRGPPRNPRAQGLLLPRRSLRKQQDLAMAPSTASWRSPGAPARRWRWRPRSAITRSSRIRGWNNINWNYGMLPQTWEDPKTEIEGAFGDNDPVDVVEIGGTRAQIGDVIKVKPLAALALIDEGELDWKIVAISLDSPRASLVNDANDVEKHFPGTLVAVKEWYRDYKIPEGKQPNRFGFSNKALNKDCALEVIMKTNESWRKLVEGSVPSGELSLV